MPTKAKGVDVLLLSIRDVIKGAQVFEHVKPFTTPPVAASSPAEDAVAAVRLNPSLADGVPLLTKMNVGKFGAPD